MWKLKYTNDAKKDLESLRSSTRSTKKKISDLLEIIKKDPYNSSCKRLTGDLRGSLSLKINRRDRLVYQILPEEKVVKVIRVLTHYGN